MNKDLQETVSVINGLVSQYIELADKDNVPIHILLQIQDHLTGHSFFLSRHVSDYRDKSKRSEFTYNSNIVQAEHQYTVDGLKTLTAKTAAKFDNKEKEEQAMELENTYKRLKLTLYQTNKVINSITQKISFLKQESLKS